MTRTITALFDDRGDANAAQERLRQSQVDADHIRIHDKQSEGFHETGHSTHEHRGIWASIKNAFLPDNDRHTYEEGVRRGGYLLTVDVEDDAVAEAVRVLEDANTVDIDERAEGWRSSGWQYPASGATVGAAASGATSEGAVGRADPASEYDVDSATLSSGYASRDLDRSSSRVRTYGGAPFAGNEGVSTTHHTGSKLSGLADEGIGNAKQAAGSVFGSESLKRDGMEQERRGEAEQGKQHD
jgi:uncharacterized protein YjbJ (UPF0337 family)